MARFFIFLGVLTIFHTAAAQVVNNNVQDRVELHPDGAPVFSDTENSTVEWNCINKSLTNKCLVYHNDQWFFFSVPEPGLYFLNISAQECRKSLGLQVILIEGNPCEVSTYRIKTCIDRIPQDDVYVPLDSLKAGVQYLVNIDGFLNDFCTFNIRLSTKADGLPYRLENSGTLDVQWEQPGTGIVSLKWQVNESIANSSHEFLLYKLKQGEVKSTLDHRQPIVKNAYGTPQLTYTVMDTLAEYGIYRFSLFARDGDNSVYALSTYRVSYQPERVMPFRKERIVTILLGNRKRSMIEVYVYDRFKERLLRKLDFFADPRSSTAVAIDLGTYIDEGYNHFLVELVNRKSRSVSKYPYKLDESGFPVPE